MCVYLNRMTDMMTFWHDHISLLLSLSAAGVGAGIVAGLFGVGGGTIIVPVLYALLTALGYPADLAMHVAIGTSLATIMPTAISSSRAHWRRGAVNMAVLRQLWPATALGAIVGVIVASYTRGIFLTLLFAIFAAVTGLLMLRGQKGFSLVKGMPRPPRQHALGGFIGMFSSMLGIGGGTVSVPTLAACGLVMPMAVGTGSALGLAIAIPGALGFMVAGWPVGGLPPLSLGYVNLLAFAFIAPLSALFAPLGARLAHALPELWLRYGFAAYLLLIAGRMAYKALG